VQLRLKPGDEVEHLGLDRRIEPVVGSSRIRSDGSFASAIAMITRCCIPPES